ncbi:SDR family NAD(P)-dependent oxidoreductase [Streptomyces sp. NPDC047042]|uniref:SDR family NAD(P)-dependent oxidoreductase n=1 Tax=Streptomyces sp. NPDC047042 TaxID=3154807 RepID=UPI0033FCF56D
MESQALKGRIALVTGGTTGLGLGAAKRLIEEGATVYVTGRRKDVLDAAAENLGPSATATSTYSSATRAADTPRPWPS